MATAIPNGATLSVALRVYPGGDWWCEATLDGGDVPPVGAATLQFGDIALTGGVIRSGEDYAGKPHLVMVGAPGWQTLITRPIAFQVDSGVRLGTVLDALARGAGCRIEKPPDHSLGPYYEITASRQGDPVRYADALNALVRDGAITTWRVDFDGVTRFTARTSKAVAGRATLVRRDTGVGLAIYGTDAPSEWLPGNTVDPGSGAEPIGRVELYETQKKLEAHVYQAGTSAVGTLLENVRRMTALAFEDIVRVYKVAAVVGDDKRLNLVPPAGAGHLPQLANVKQFNGGGTVEPQPGSEVLVWARRRDRPIVFAFENGSIPALVRYGAATDAEANPIALEGGIVDVFFPPLIPVSGLLNGVQFAGQLTIVTSASGMIADGTKSIRAKPT